MTEIHLFVQEGCRPCMYAETQLKKVDGWDKVVQLTNAKENGEITEFAKQCGVEATPTLIALVDGNVVAKVAGSENLTKEFWEATISKHGS
jgi:hypothetical protein